MGSDVINWLLENAGASIRYNLDKSVENAELLLKNSELEAWWSRLATRSQTNNLGERLQANNIGDIHGSHDYRMENILGKCWILGLSKNIYAFAENINARLHIVTQITAQTPCILHEEQAHRK